MGKKYDYNIIRFISLLLILIFGIIAQAICPLWVRITCWASFVLLLDLTICRIYLRYRERREKYYWCTFKYQLKEVLCNYNIFRYIKNFFFCLRFPFWRSRNVWTGEFYGYSYTWYDHIPEGWRKAFGIQLSKDIKKAFKEDKKENKKLKWKDALYWEQIKEKWGGLRLYASASNHIYEVLDKYEELSFKYCINCGKPTEYVTSGWVTYLCGDCFVEYCERYGINAKLLNDSKVIDFLEEHRIKEKIEESDDEY